MSITAEVQGKDKIEDLLKISESLEDIYGTTDKHFINYQKLLTLFPYYEYAEDPKEIEMIKNNIIKETKIFNKISNKYKIKIRFELKKYPKAYKSFNKYL